MTGEKSSGINVTVSAPGDPLDKSGATSFLVDVGPAGGHAGALGALAALADVSSLRSSLPITGAPEDEDQKPAIISGGTNSPSFPSDEDEMPPPPPRTKKAVTLLEPMHPSTSAPLENAPRFTFLSGSETHGFHSQPAMGRIRLGTGGGRLGRLRSASNPEGMEKWDSYRRNDRLHFVLPSSIIEEELAEVSDKLRSIRSSSTSRSDGAEPIGRATTAPIAIQAHPQQPSTMACASDEASQESQLRRSKRAPKPKVFGTSPSSVAEHLGEGGVPLAPALPKPPAKKSNRPRSNSKTKCVVKASNRASTGGKKKRMMAVNLARAGIVPKSEESPNEDEEEVDESKLEPEELLRRARARLLEDMGSSIADSQSDRPGDEITLPHSLAKYKEVRSESHST